MQSAQECVNVLNGYISDRRQYELLDLAVRVYNFGAEIIYGENNEWMSLKTINYRYNVNKSFFIITCALQRVFSGWTVVDMDTCDQIRFQKKCSNPREACWIFDLICPWRAADDDDWRRNGSIVTIFIPTCMLSKYRGIGLMF